MADELAPSATTTTEAPETSILGQADQPVVSENESVLDVADAEEKASRDANNKRILEADEKTLSPEDKTTREGLLKAKQEEVDKKAAEIRAKGVPEKYELKPPEGTQLDAQALERVTPIFKKLGITNEQAQGLSDYYAQLQKDTVTKSAETLKTWNEQNVKDTMAHPGIKEELKSVAKVKNMLSPETIEALNASGIGNMKHFILDMAKVGKLFSEEHLVNDNTTSKPNSGGESREEVAHKFYPNMNK
jgi:hypothetical protein